MRIDIEEMLDIIGYAIGEDAAQLLKRHFRVYKDYGRLKQLLTSSLIEINRERQTQKIIISQQRRKIEELAQLSFGEK